VGDLSTPPDRNKTHRGARGIEAVAWYTSAASCLLDVVLTEGITGKFALAVM
jgi:hypothetical protein